MRAQQTTMMQHLLSLVRGRWSRRCLQGQQKNLTAAQVATCVQHCLCKQEGQQTYWLASRRAIRDDRQIGYVCAWTRGHNKSVSMQLIKRR